jgi:gliding-associated putative ABC transporter substrate-binding component GldG
MEEKKIIISESKKIKLVSWLQFIVIGLTVLLVSGLSSFFSVRLDLTEDKRYTLSGPSHEVLSRLKNDVYIQVYLDGEMPIAFKRLRRSVKELLDEFRIASGRKVDYEFINPSEAKDIKTRNNQYQSLDSKGLNRVNIRANDAEGGSSQKIIFPGMIVNYNGIEIPVNFLSNNRALSAEQNLLNSVEGLEYEMIQTISTVSSDTIYKVAFIEGHNEIPEIEVADITLSLAKFFTVDRGVIGGRPGIMDKYAAIVIAGPEKSFNEKDKLVIDQYIMNGGKVLWLYDEVKVNEDSLVYGETVALYRPLNLEDQLFKYGIRINPSIIEDMECILIPMHVGTGESQQVVSMPWFYYPLLNPSVNNPITRNLNKVLGKFVNYIDTVGRDPDIKKTVLLTTSGNARIINPPVLISLKEAALTPDESQFNKSHLPVAVLLTGKFHSAFRNMLVNDLVEDKNFRIKTESDETKMIVVADADMIRNDVSRVGGTENFLPLGLDRYTQQTFGNKDFLINCLNYLVDNNGIMTLRSRELKLRLLDKTVIKQKRFMIQIINIAAPVLLVILAGFLYGIIRRKLYTK